MAYNTPSTKPARSKSVPPDAEAAGQRAETDMIPPLTVALLANIDAQRTQRCGVVGHTRHGGVLFERRRDDVLKAHGAERAQPENEQ